MTWSESRQIPEKLSAHGYKYLDRGGSASLMVPDSGGMTNRAAVDHFVHHDSRRALLISVSTVLEQKEKPLKSRGLADDSW